MSRLTLQFPMTSRAGRALDLSALLADLREGFDAVECVEIDGAFTDLETGRVYRAPVCEFTVGPVLTERQSGRLTKIAARHGAALRVLSAVMICDDQGACFDVAPREPREFMSRKLRELLDAA